jgi:hypothetical protein
LIVEEGAYLEANCQTTDKISLEKPAISVLLEKNQEIEPKP